MSTLLATGLVGGIASLALLCCILGIGQTIRQQQTTLACPGASTDACAWAICSACYGRLSGLESHCPTCGKRLHYQVPGAPSQRMPDTTFRQTPLSPLPVSG